MGNTHIKSNKTIVLLILIFCLALVVRILWLGSLPGNFHEDEVLVGYVGRYIFMNGVDLHNNVMPLWYFNKFGDYYIIGPFYLSGLSTLIFGIREFAVRFPAALLGALAVFPIYGISIELFKNKVAGLFAAFSLSLMPWHVVLSRTSSEGVIGATLCITAVYFMQRWIRTRVLVDFAFAVLTYLASYWIYHPYRIYAPVFIFITLLIYRKELLSSKRLGAIFLSFIAFLALTLWIISTPWGKGRLSQTSILSPISGVSIRTQELIYDSKNIHPIVTRIFHNKIVGYSKEFIRQYFSYLSPNYLFSDGWGERFQLKEQGMLYLVYFAYLSAFVLSTSSLCRAESTTQKSTQFYLSILMTSLIPPSFTYIGSPNINRSMFFGVLLAIAIGFGMYRLWRAHAILFYLSFLILFLEVFQFFFNYTQHFDTINSIARQDASKPLITYISQFNTERVFLPKQKTKAIYYLFYTQNFEKSLAGKFKHDVQIDSIKNVRFIEESNCLVSVQDIESISDLREGDIVAFDYTCRERDVEDKKFELLTHIKQEGDLLGYRVYRYRGSQSQFLEYE